MAPPRIAGSAAVSAPSASCAQVSDTTTAAPRQASASPAHAVTPPVAGTRGSNPRTTAPAAHRPAAICEPASPSPSTATTGGSGLLISWPPPPGVGPGGPRASSALGLARGAQASSALGCARGAQASSALGRAGGAQSGGAGDPGSGGCPPG